MASQSTAPRGSATLRSVVKVLTVSDAPDYEQPWQTRGPVSSSGSGAVVQTSNGLRILTNAHVVENQVFVEVRRYGNSTKFVAEVEGVGHECDLALLRVDDHGFFAGADPLAYGPLPALGDRVSVLGYPIGGDRLSITEGVVSRIEVSPYAQTQRPLLAIQLDAAINSGNSGGPVFKDDRLIGVAFQALDEGENISYAIAGPIVEHFLQDVEDGTFDGFPDLGATWQALESKAHRRYLGLPPKCGGVLVTGVAYASSASSKIKRGDVLLAVDGVSVASDGTVPLRKGELVDFSYIVSRRQVGEKMPVTLWRKGQRQEAQLDLKPPMRLVPQDRYDVRPTYYVFGGLVFVPLTRDYLKAWGEEWWRSAPYHLLALYEEGIRSKDRLEVVVLSKVLADRANQGYHDVENAIVTHVDGRKVACMKDVVRLTSGARGRYVRIQLSSGGEIVLERKAVRDRGASILKRYRVPAERSDDLR